MFADVVKYIFFRACKEEDVVLIFLIPEFIYDYIFGAKKDKLFCPVFVFHKGMSNDICDLVLHLLCENLNILLIYPGTIPLQYLKSVFAIRYSTLPLAGSHFIFLK